MDTLIPVVIALSFVNVLGLLLLIFQSHKRTDAITDILQRVTRIEANYEHTLDQEDLSDIKESLSGLVTDVATINERWQVTNRTMNTIQQHLLDEDRK